MKFKLFFLLLFVISYNSFAGAAMFSIQILASQSPDITALKASSGLDDVYTEETGFGLTRVKVGAYNNRDEAELDLESIQSNGFPDAFITSYKGQQSAVSAPTPSRPLSHMKSPAWSRLTEEQKRNVVYLDGVLHLHEDDKFIPLASLE